MTRTRVGRSHLIETDLLGKPSIKPNEHAIDSLFQFRLAYLNMQKRTMNKTLLLIHAAAVAAMVTCAGCRSTARATVNPNSASAGQQLMDLKKALDNGLITQKEYERMRKEIVKKNE
jgi:hypothetical protein